MIGVRRRNGAIAAAARSMSSGVTSTPASGDEVGAGSHRVTPPFWVNREQSTSEQAQGTAKLCFRLVELQHLRSFVTAARLGSFNAAAQELNYTGPAISQHVAALEQELGVEILTRHARGVVVTPAGDVLLRRAVELLDLAAGAAHEVRLAARTPSVVRVGAFSTAAQFLLPPVLTAVLTERPNVELVLIDREPPDGFADVVAGRLDVMVTHAYSGTDAAVPAQLVSEPLLRDDLVLLVPATHSFGDTVRLGDLVGERWISGPSEAQNHVALEWASARAGFVPEVAFETTDYAVTMTLVANGLGLAFVPRLILASAPTGLRIVDVSDATDLHRLISVVHRDPVRSEVVEVLLRELRIAAAAAAKMPT